MGTGLVAGLIGAAGLSRYTTSLLFAVKPSDSGVYIGGSVLFLVIGLVAYYLPDRRAAKIDPMVALRVD